MAMALRRLLLLPTVRRPLPSFTGAGVATWKAAQVHPAEKRARSYGTEAAACQEHTKRLMRADLMVWPIYMTSVTLICCGPHFQRVRKPQDCSN